MTPDPVLALDVAGLSKSFGGVTAVDDVSFSIPDGSITALIGPNGAGKSTLFNLLTNLYRADSGTVHFYGLDLAGASATRIARAGLIRTFQTARVFPGMTVLENVLIGAHLSLRSPLWQQSLGLPNVRQEERHTEAVARELLALFDLSRNCDESAMRLSLGSQKLVEVARALLASPRVLLLDEPAAGLNDVETNELARILRSVNATGITIIVVEHNMSFVMGLAQNVLVLDAGKLIARGSPAHVQSDPSVIEAYVGRGTDDDLLQWKTDSHAAR